MEGTTQGSNTPNPREIHRIEHLADTIQEESVRVLKYAPARIGALTFVVSLVSTVATSHVPITSGLVISACVSSVQAAVVAFRQAVPIQIVQQHVRETAHAAVADIDPITDSPDEK